MSEEIINSMDIDALAAQAAEQDDFTKSEAGGFDRELIPEGPCFVRLREYVEVGVQPQPEWKTKAYGPKPGKPQARWAFEVVAAVRIHPEGHEKAGERYNAARRTVTPEGKEAFEVSETIHVRTDISKNAKSGHFKLFKALNAPYGMQYKVPAQLLSCEGWKARIVHSYKKEDLNEDGTPKAGAKPAYQNLRTDQGWTFEAPVKEDPETGSTTRIKVPELCEGPGSRKLYLWDSPNKACWDSLFIEGQRDERDKDGKETGKRVSKNFIQELILSASNFKGSPTEIMLSGTGDLEEMADAAVSKPTSSADPLDDLD